MDKIYFSEKNFKARAVRSSVICMAVMAAAFALFYGAVNYRESICGIELGVFGAEIAPPTVVTDGSTAESGDLQFGVEDCIISGDTVSFTLYGKNCGEERWESDGSDFVVATLNTAVSGVRGRYYSTLTEHISAGPQEEFSAKMVFEIQNAEEKLGNGYIFSLSAFSGNSRPEAEIVLADGHKNTAESGVKQE